jgi:hypothetical protein
MGINLTNMKNSVAIVLGGSALVALMFVFAARSDVPQTVGTTVSVREDDQFDEVWREAAVNSALKSASLQLAEPKLVQTEVILPTVIARPEELTPKLKRKLIMERDVCQRHGMRKVYRGKGWRCKR